MKIFERKNAIDFVRLRRKRGTFGVLNLPPRSCFLKFKMADFEIFD